MIRAYVTTVLGDVHDLFMGKDEHCISAWGVCEHVALCEITEFFSKCRCPSWTCHRVIFKVFVLRDAGTSDWVYDWGTEMFAQPWDVVFGWYWGLGLDC